MSRLRKNKPKPLVWAEVDLSKLRRNLRVVRSMFSGTRTETLAVVKADAYGHGMVEIAKTLRAEGVRFFGVANAEEALELRRVIGPTPKILVLGSLRKEDLPYFVGSNLIPTISSLEEVEALAQGLKKPLNVHVKIDTGMGRLGVWHREAGNFFNALRSWKEKVRVDGVYTHFSSADNDVRKTRAQMIFFEEAVRQMKRLGFSPRYLHAANSAGLVRFRGSHLNLVRPGILLYGVMPGIDEQPPRGLKPILELKTVVSFLKHIKKGRTVSYGSTWKAPKNTTIATLPIGYSHGYRRGFSNKGTVLIRGCFCPVIGRVTMDQTLVDVGSLPTVRRGDEVTLIGCEEKKELTASGLASLAHTIPYEIFCSIHPRIPRVYKGIRG